MFTTLRSKIFAGFAAIITVNIVVMLWTIYNFSGIGERVEDIPLLASYFVQQYQPENNEGLQLSEEALSAIKAYNWQGNVRELENVISRAAYLARGNEISLDDLPEDFQALRANELGSSQRLEDVEREHIQRVIAESESYEKAAHKLNIDPATL
ncbi:MAG: hypothetical protein J4G05_00665 [Chlorobi bacterium]|nr:hypothetical protein [Chlorobiota bacterium]